ncbi:hypothetical protein U724_30020 [Pseudomonas chlororaphis subsp. aurantiaca PB-St2]|nr:hypothetical protein U724_30020 [Pseudomonas chlororaphis subsp. aurantiaca PB-St2]
MSTGASEIGLSHSFILFVTRQFERKVVSDTHLSQWAAQLCRLKQIRTGHPVRLQHPLPVLDNHGPVVITQRYLEFDHTLIKIEHLAGILFYPWLSWPSCTIESRQVMHRLPVIFGNGFFVEPDDGSPVFDATHFL